MAAGGPCIHVILLRHLRVLPLITSSRLSKTCANEREYYDGVAGDLQREIDHRVQQGKDRNRERRDRNGEVSAADLCPADQDRKVERYVAKRPSSARPSAPKRPLTPAPGISSSTRAITPPTATASSTPVRRGSCR